MIQISLSLTMIAIQFFVSLIALKKGVERRSFMWFTMFMAFLFMVMRRVTAVLTILYPRDISYVESVLDKTVLPLLISVLLAIGLGLFAKKDSENAKYRIEKDAELESLLASHQENQRILIEEAKKSAEPKHEGGKTTS